VLCSHCSDHWTDLALAAEAADEILAETFGLPVRAVGVGEKAGDLRAFDATDYARGLVGLG